MEFFAIIKKPANDYDPQSCRRDFEYDDSVVKSRAPQSPECGTYIGMFQAKLPFRVHFETWASCYGSFACWMTDFSVSRGVRDAYGSSSLSGLSKIDAAEIVQSTNDAKVENDSPEYFRTLPTIVAATLEALAFESNGKTTNGHRVFVVLKWRTAAELESRSRRRELLEWRRHFLCV